MAHPIPILRRPLQELEAAIDAKDIPAVCRHASRLVELSGGLWAHRPQYDASGIMMPEDGRGDRAEDCRRILAKLNALEGQASATGLPWDGSFLRAILEWLMKLLIPIFLPHG